NPGNAGWQIQKSGAAEFNGVVITRANVVADSGSAGNYYPPAGWHFEKVYVSAPSAGNRWFYVRGNDRIYDGTYTEQSVYAAAHDGKNGGVTFAVDTGYITTDDITDNLSASFVGRAQVFTASYSYSGGAFSGTAFYLDAECSVGFMRTWAGPLGADPDQSQKRIILYITVRLNPSVYPQVTNIRANQISWALHRLT
ncbi:MAG TPA: hypothetical protein PK011_10745, partial [Marinagarivorans sp.]|nr:hypothetical protein [Marinagarivorans sp.]